MCTCLRAVVASILCLLASSAFGASVTFAAVPLGGKNWRYVYEILNNSPGVSIGEFTVYFAPGLYANLSAGAVSGWDVLVVQPDPVIPDDGFFDGLAIGPAAVAPGGSASGFSVSFTYLGAGSPGAQPFEIVDPQSFQSLVTGKTVPVVTQKIAGLYVGFFERAADLDGQSFWKAVAKNSGLNDLALMRLMATGFANHPSFAAIYGSLSNDEYVDAIYRNIGGRSADAAGKAYWLGRLNSAQLTRSDFVADFVYGLLEITEKTLQDLVNSGAITEQERQDALSRKYRMTHKTEIASVFLLELGPSSNLSPGTDPLSPASLAADPAYRASQNIVRPVTEDPASKEAPLAYLAGDPTIDGINLMFGP